MTSKSSTKKSFILKQSKKLSAAEVVAKGKAAGLKFSASYVHVIRFRAKPESQIKRRGPHKKAKRK